MVPQGPFSGGGHASLPQLSHQEREALGPDLHAAGLGCAAGVLGVLPSESALLEVLPRPRGLGLWCWSLKTPAGWQLCDLDVVLKSGFLLTSPVWYHVGYLLLLLNN